MIMGLRRGRLSKVEEVSEVSGWVSEMDGRSKERDIKEVYWREHE